MKEPANPHFVLSDGTFCQFLDDRLVIGKADLPGKNPVPSNRPDPVSLGLMIAALLVLGFLLVMTVIAHFYIITLTLGLLFSFTLVSFVRSVKYSATPVIMKGDILSVKYHKRGIGYDFFVIIYSGKDGKAWLRRLAIYDSQQCLDQALQVMHEQGLLRKD